MSHAHAQDSSLPEPKAGDGVEGAPLLVPVEEEEGEGEGEPDAHEAQLLDGRSQHCVENLQVSDVQLEVGCSDY